MFESETFVRGKSVNLPDKEMTGSELVRSVIIGPETYTPIELAPDVSSSSVGKRIILLQCELFYIVAVFKMSLGH